MNKGTLYTSYFAKIKQGKGIKISVARFNPRWLNPSEINDWFDDLAPSVELLNNYKNGKVSWDKYYLLYKSWLKDAFVVNTRVNTMIKAIENCLNSGGDVTLYCYEKSADNCHRHILGEIFKEMGYEVKEIE